MVDHIALVVGNGLSLDLRSYLAPRLDRWHPSRPLDWLSEVISGNLTLRQLLPRFSAEIDLLTARPVELNDFQLFDLLRRRSERGGGQAAGEKELRNFLALAYTLFQREADRYPLTGWPWLARMSEWRQSLAGVISFNYDLVPERLLAAAGISCRRFGVDEESGVVMAKPHGSIDFDSQGTVAAGGRLRLLPKKALFKPRVAASIVLPREGSPLLDFPWVEEGYRWFEEIGRGLSHCLILGLSYQLSDQPEIDRILSCLHPTTVVILANPRPPRALVKELDRRHLRTAIWLNAGSAAP